MTMKQVLNSTRQVVELNEKRELETLRRMSRYLEVLHELALSQVNLNSLDGILWNVAKTAIAKPGFVDCVIYLPVVIYISQSQSIRLILFASYQLSLADKAAIGSLSNQA